MRVAFGYAVTHLSAFPLERASKRQQNSTRTSWLHFSLVLQTFLSGQFAWEGAVALAGKEDAGCVVSHRYPVLRGRPGIALTEYLLALLSTRHGNFLLNENSRGAAGRNRPLNIASLLKEKVPIPDVATQEAIGHALRQRNELFKEIIKQIAFLQERRASLVCAAVTGKIDVRGFEGTSAPRRVAAA